MVDAGGFQFVQVVDEVCNDFPPVPVDLEGKHGRIVVVESDGSFAFTTTLSEGENQFTVKASDKAGNSTEAVLKLNFSPKLPGFPVK